jgi:hypothetical protein
MTNLFPREKCKWPVHLSKGVDATSKHDDRCMYVNRTLVTPATSALRVLGVSQQERCQGPSQQHHCDHPHRGQPEKESMGCSCQATAAALSMGRSVCSNELRQTHSHVP